MANISKTFTLVDKFSGPLQQYINKLKTSVENGNKAESGLNKMAGQAQETGNKLKQMGDKAKAATDSAAKAGSEGAKTFSDMGGKLAQFAALAAAAVAAVKSFQASAERAPKEVLKPFTELKQTFSDIVASPIVAFMKSIGDGVKRLNTALKSDAGKKFLRGINALTTGLGKIVNIIFDKLASGIEWLGNNFQKVAAYGAAGLGILTALMVVFAAATIAANWPILLMIGLIVAVIKAMNAAGVTASEIFNAVGQGFGWLYATGYNLVADAYNLIATFAEFFANVFNNPVRAIGRLFTDLFTWILDLVNTAAGALGALFGQDWGSVTTGLQNKVQSWADSTLGENAIKIDRMDKKTGADTMEMMADWGKKFENFGNSLSDISLASAQDVELTSGISKDTGSMAKTITNDDLKNMVDMATQRFVNNVNLTSTTPVITVNGANTGNTAADRRAIANAIKSVLTEEMAAGSVVSSEV